MKKSFKVTSERWKGGGCSDIRWEKIPDSWGCDKESPGTEREFVSRNEKESEWSERRLWEQQHYRTMESTNYVHDKAYVLKGPDAERANVEYRMIS